MKQSTKKRAALDAALSDITIELSQEQKDLLLTHLDLVIEKNKMVNLTRITNYQEALVLHIVDSLSLIKKMSRENAGFCDIGTGAGFPGIPIAIATGYKGVLMDSVKKKANAVQEFLDELGLSDQVKAMGIRSEEYATTHSKRFDYVVARAVSSLPTVLELASPLLHNGGQLLAMRGEDSKEDIDRALKASTILGFKMVERDEFTIGNGEYHRSICVFERVSKPSIKLPRRPGMATHNPVA